MGSFTIKHYSLTYIDLLGNCLSFLQKFSLGRNYSDEAAIYHIANGVDSESVIMLIEPVLTLLTQPYFKIIKNVN